MAEVIPLPPQFLAPMHSDECVLLSYAEIQAIQREAMRAGIEAAAQAAGPARLGSERVADTIRGLRIEGEQP